MRQGLWLFVKALLLLFGDKRGFFDPSERKLLSGVSEGGWYYG